MPASLFEILFTVFSGLHLAVMRLQVTGPVHYRRVFEGLRIPGSGVQLHYSPVPLHPYHRRLGFEEGDFPKEQAYACNAISLPLYIMLNQQEWDRLVQAFSSLVD